MMNGKSIKILITATLFACLMKAGTAKAEIIANPDPNTLWREDGSSATKSDGPSSGHWNGELDIKAVDGNLQLNATDNKKYSLGHYVKTDPHYPFLVFHVLNYVPQPGYHGFTLTLNGDKQVPGLSLVGQISSGIYVLDLSQFLSKPTTSYLRFDLYNAQLTLSDLSMVKTPPNRIEITSPALVKNGYIAIGDEITFTVYLEKKTEDASLTFYDNYTMPQLKINGLQTLQLKPKDADQKVWSATIKLQSIDNLRSEKNQQLAAFHLMAKATILGGSLKEPLWTSLGYPIHLENSTPAAK